MEEDKDLRLGREKALRSTLGGRLWHSRNADRLGEKAQSLDLG